MAQVNKAGVLIPVELQSWGSRRSRRSKRRCYSTGRNNDRLSWSNTRWMTPSDERLRLKGWQDWVKNFLGLQKIYGGARHCLVRRRRVPNGCAQPVFRVQRSHGGGYMIGGAGINAASSAQSRHVGGGEMARLGPGWNELGKTGSEMGMGGERGASMGIDSVDS